MADAAVLGYPRIGKQRELKRTTEGYWSGKVSATNLLQVANGIRQANWETQRDARIALIPSNDFSLYDQMLDTIALVGAVPDRYHWNGQTVDLDTYFAMARGAQREGLDVTAMEMTKWFNTNYHYIVPELAPNQQFRLSSTKPFDEYMQAKGLGIETRPVLIGPVSFLLLGKSTTDGFDPLELLDALLPIYGEVISRLESLGARWIQIDEPCLVMDCTDRERQAIGRAYANLAQRRGKASLSVQTYFAHVGASYDTLVNLPVQGIGLDFVHGAENLDFISNCGFPQDKILAAGLVDGHSVWITDLQAALDIVDQLLVSVSGTASRSIPRVLCYMCRMMSDSRMILILV
jgi:5-methyltetrahydropteroyltriglutamate--homocysteine methyltransferase